MRFLPVLGLMTMLAVISSVITPVRAQCPGDGTCCAANGSPGCSEFNCCSDVCVSDPFCCDVEWDSLCADIALNTCFVCGAGCPGPGNCCEANGSSGCNDAFCCDMVCASDPFCCTDVWDITCAQAAQGLCGICTLLCPGGGDCCVNNGTPGCNDETCCEQVCAIDPQCCDAFWDGICASHAQSLCAGCQVQCSPPTLTFPGTFVVPDQVLQETQITVVFEVVNSSPCDFPVLLSSSIRLVGSPKFVTSPECDATVTSPAGTTTSFSTCFNLPMGLPAGQYEVCYELRDAISMGLFDGFCSVDLFVLMQADLNGDQTIGTEDLLLLLELWGACDVCLDCPADLNGDCAVDTNDFLMLLSLWG